MKKIYSFVLLSLSIFFALALFACAGKYDSMSMSATISFSYSADGVEELEDGTYRVVTADGTFDAHPDGSYTLYIDRQTGRACRANISVSFSNVPGDFSYGLIFEQNNEILNIISQDLQNEVVTVKISAGSVGQTKLTIRSAEGDRSDSLYINVVEINNNFHFNHDNIALVNKSESSLELSSKVTKEGSGNLSFTFGTEDGENFIPYTSAELASHGLSYDSNRQILSVTASSTDLHDMTVCATLTNPLGETFSQFSTIHFVHAIENLQIYKGSRKSDIKEENLVSNSDFIEFVNNYASLNVLDFVLVVENNGQLVNFNVASNSYLENIFPDNISYVNDSGELIDNVAFSAKALCHIRMISNLKTTNLDGKQFTQIITCDYAEYSVDNYPISTSFNAKIYDLIKNFSINGTFAENFDIDDVNLQDVPSFEVYSNSIANYKGTKVAVGLALPVVVEVEHAFYNLSLYSSSGDLISNPDNFLEIYDAIGELTSFSSNFRLPSQLYLKPRTSNGATYYLCVSSKDPSDNALKASTIVKIVVCLGISSMDKADYSVNSYTIDDETGDFILDESGNKIIKTVEEKDVAFDGNSLSKDINIDIDVIENRSEVKLYCSPLDASLSSLEYAVENENIATITLHEELKNVFYINPVSVGSTIIYITSGDLTYSIRVNVFTPITNFYVFLSDSTSDNVSSAEVDEDASLQSVLAKSGVTIPLRLVALPNGVTQYSLEYMLEKWSDENAGYVEFEGNKESLSYEEILKGGISKRIKNGESFVYYLSDNSFIFNNTNTSKYKLTIKLKNNGGNVITREIILQAYNPSTISLSLTKKKIYNTSSVSYLSRFLGMEGPDSPDILTEVDTLNSDPTCFGVKVTETSMLGAPTYSFANYGQIRFIRNGLDEGRFALENGQLVEINSNLIQAVSNYEIGGYYFFRLKDNSHTNSFSLVMEVTLKEQFTEENYHTITKNSTLSISNATKVSSIVAQDDLNLSFNADGDTTKTLSFKVMKENAYNKRLVSYTYRVYSINSRNYFVYDEDFIQTALTEVSSGNYSLFVDAASVGKGRIVLLPEDAITTQSMYLGLRGRSQSIVLSSLSDYVDGLLFADANLTTLVSNPQVGNTYYINAINQEEFNDSFGVYSEVYVSVNDGSVGNEYEISTFEELSILVSSPEYANKNYKIVKDLYADSGTNFTSLASFYKIDILSNYPAEDVYVCVDGEYNKVDKIIPFNSANTYYGYGFNGHLSGEVLYESISGSISVKYYSISGLFYDGNNDDRFGGLFVSLGTSAKISDLSIIYERYSSNVSNMTFGGLTALNYGEIENVSLNIGSSQSDRIEAQNDLVFGGLVGINYGVIENTNMLATVTCSMKITISSSEDLFVGGICGKNYGLLYGNFNILSDIDEIKLNDAEISAIIDLELTGSSTVSSIGGAVGYNEGLIKYVVVSGKVSADDFTNVGGIVGQACYNQEYNNVEEETYSISYSYSTAVVSGSDNVGGSIGSVSGDVDKLVALYYVSAENYADREGNRTFVKANLNVGGFVGVASYMWAKYCYVATYFKGNGTDVESMSDDAGAFASVLIDSVISASSCKVNVKGANVSLFTVTDSSNNIEGVISYGSVEGEVINPVTNASNYLIIVVKEDGPETQAASGNIGELDYVGQDGDDYYIFINLNGQNQPLFVNSDITITANIKDNSGEYVNYLKGNQSKSLVLFFNHESTGKYTEEQLNALNTINLFSGEIVGFEISPKTIKTNRVNFTSYNPDVIRVNQDGTITLLKEGTATLHISSKLNDFFDVDLQVSVISGINEIGLYDSISFINEVGVGIAQSTVPELNLLIGEESLFVDKRYEREPDYALGAMGDVGFRFIVEKDDNLAESLGANAISEVFTFSSLTWDSTTDGKYYYVDVDGESELKIITKKTLEKSVKIVYVPYIVVQYTESKDTIFLENFRKQFMLKISHGATDIRLADNASGDFSLYQHESLVFTVIIDTTFEDDKIFNNSEAFMGEDGEFYDRNFTLMESSSGLQKIRDAGGNLIAMSMTYTFSYKDKLGNIEDNYSSSYNYYNEETGCVEYVYKGSNGEEVPLRFYALSQPNKVCEVYLNIKNKSTLDDLRVNLYSSASDYPRRSNSSNIVYNETKAYVSLEVYPYFTSYSSVRVSYTSRDSNNMIISQVSYENDVFKNLSTSPIVYTADSILVDKTTAQDVFVGNTDDTLSGIYSYGKTYFFSITLPSSTPNNASFTLLFEVLNKKKEVISSKHITITSLVQPRIDMSLDSALQEKNTSEHLYYLPIYTDNILSVTTVNESGEIIFDVSIEGAEGLSNYESIKANLMPVYRDGNYHIQVFSYEEGEDLTSFIGKKVTITARMASSDVTSNESKVEFIITLFTIRSIYISGAKDGLLSLATNNVSPLKLSIDAYYDYSIDSSSNNWYSAFYSSYDADTSLAQSLVSAGYEISDSINVLFNQLCEKIAVLKSENAGVISSPVFYYDAGDDKPHQLSNQSKYDSLEVELYNNHFALYSNDADRRYKIYSEVSFVEYSKGDNFLGIANIQDYLEKNTPKSRFSFADEKIVAFDNVFSFLNPIPVSTAQEFLEMEDDKDYRLVKDIELNNYEPIDCKVSSFDGNGYTIYITSFSYDEMQSGSAEVGLFKTIDASSIVSNVTVYYTPKVTELASGSLSPENSGTMTIGLYNISSFMFGGLACSNNGIITNCSVKGHVSISLNTSASSEYPIVVSSSLTAGLVAQNYNTITYSRVVDFSLSNRGETGGFVANNNGRIISCYVDNCALSNLSNSNVGGFCFTNNGEIRECYVQGGRSVDDITIQNTASGISSDGGYVGGFIFNNNGTIDDCYSNIRFVSSYRSAGFVYQESASSVISRCYSISYKDPDDNRTTAFPFAGPTQSVEDRVEINGELNNCYFISSSGYRTVNFYASDSNLASATPSNKKATALSLDNFATHTNFTTYDLSLDYSSQKYSQKDSTEEISYNYVDGYTWVILEGKPVLSSTLTPTYSWQKYLGKIKDYEDEITYFDSNSDNVTSSTQTVLSGVTETTYLLDDSVIYTLLNNSNSKTKEYTFYHDGYREITLRYSYATGSDELIACTYGSDSVVDYEEYAWKKREGSEDEYYLEQLNADKNFRASDTVEIIYNGDTKSIIKVNFKVLNSVQYSYNTSSSGSRTNPYLIFDYNSFNYYFTSVSQSDVNFYRFISNVDLRRNFTSTSYSSLSGIVQGSYMAVDNIYLSYTNINDEGSIRNTRTFGLFSQVTTTAGQDTIISNLTFNVAHVVSHTHDFVGVLAGAIEPQVGGKIFINNVDFVALSDSTGVFGVHAVGALAGYMAGKVVIKDISSSLNVTANFHQVNPDKRSILYKDAEDVSGLSIVGGVIGIFDVSPISNNSTFRNYNATNISVTGSNIYSGIIAGSVFGLIGKDAVVNYVNVSIPNSSRAYISSSGFAGGIAGENRGKILSSSVSYENETSTSNVLHSTLFSRYDYFYNLSTTNASGYSTIAIGGLVGYNNGGTISNSITTLNVRNIYAQTAGGAVGRMSAGTLEYVIASGSIKAKNYMGGLIGVTSNSEFMKKDYNESCIADGNITITSCLAENNYVSADYNYYYKKAGSGSNFAISSFIGIIISDDVEKPSYISFQGQSYCVDGLVATSSSSIVSYYLKPAVISKDESVPSSIPSIVLADASGEQTVFPISLESFFYENDSTGVSYTLSYRENNVTKIYSLNNVSNPSSGRVYSKNLVNFDGFYEKITSDISNFDNLINKYGEIYFKFDGEYIKVVDGDDQKDFFEHWGNVYFKPTEDGDYVSAGENPTDSTLIYYYMDSPAHWSVISFSDIPSYKASHNREEVYNLAHPKLDNMYVYRKYTASNASGYDEIVLSGPALKAGEINVMETSDHSSIDTSNSPFEANGTAPRIYVKNSTGKYALNAGLEYKYIDGENVEKTLEDISTVTNYVLYAPEYPDGQNTGATSIDELIAFFQSLYNVSPTMPKIDTVSDLFEYANLYYDGSSTININLKDDPVATPGYQLRLAPTDYSNTLITSVASIKYVYINNIRIPLSTVSSPNIATADDIKVCIEVTGDDNGTITFYKESSEPIITMYDGGKIYSLVMNYKQTKVDESKYLTTITAIECEYNYILSDNSDVSLKKQEVLNSLTYTLSIATKKIIYKAMDNGYWTFEGDFFSSSTKYPKNKEIAEVYLWTMFADTTISDSITTIRTPEDLATLALQVNKGTFGSVTVNLLNDLDLSGKYWVPIGTQEHPFKGSFDGNGHTIKYVSVNEKSTIDGNAGVFLGTLADSATLPKYAGLFGVIEDSTICDLTASGGQVFGECAGGVVAKATGSETEIYKVTNNNISTGLICSGGIVGNIEAGKLYSLVSNGSVVINTSQLTASSTSIYAGGIAGHATQVLVGADNDALEQANNAQNILANNGSVSVVDKKTSYTAGISITSYYGGLFGLLEDSTIHANLMIESGHIYNNGKIDISSNAHKLFVGGAFGKIDWKPTTFDSPNTRSNALSNISNSTRSVISIVNSNSNTQEDPCQSFVGGIAGLSTCSMYRCSNEADILFNIMDYTVNAIVVGGIVGECNVYKADESLNDNNFVTSEPASDPLPTYNFYVGECFNFSNILVKKAMSISTKVIAGGIVGGGNLHAVDDASYMEIDVFDCYNLGSIESSDICTSYLSGIVGYAYSRESDSQFYTFVGSNPDKKLNIKRCMNLAEVHVDRALVNNLISAITSVDTNNSAYVYYGEINDSDEVTYFCSNYYLKGSSYGGNVAYGGLGDANNKNESSFAQSKTSDQLKQRDTFVQTSTTVDSWDFDNVWVQEFLSWYPTLKNNKTSIMWEGRQESLEVQDNVRLIKNADELANLAYQINEGYLNSLNVQFRLSAPIDLSNRYWTPIGTKDNPFRGTFDGNGYTIKNMTIASAVGTSYGGLFGYTDGASILNVGLENAIIKEVVHAGGIVCYADNTRLEKVYSDFSISNDLGGPADNIGISATNGAGGLVYELKNSLNTSSKGLSCSYNNIPVKVTSNGGAGGLVGVLLASSIDNSYNNYYGNVQTPNPQISDVVGEIEDNTSYFTNMFSLSSKFNNSDATPVLFTQTDSNPSPYIAKSSLLPSYENLVSPSGIWTNGYSLNVNKPYSSPGYTAMDFPSIKGLNKEWKNALSENLSGINSSNEEQAINRLISLKDGADDQYAIALGSAQYSTTNSGNYKTIYTAKDLALLAQKVNSGESSASDEYILMNDIDLSSMYWTPIGINDQYPFRGTFNFNGHVIYNLTIDRKELFYAGLFGYTYNAHIINGYLENVYINIHNTLQANENNNTYVGGLVGYANNTNIYNVSCSVRLFCQTRANLYIGGLVGLASSDTSKFTISNVRVYGGESGIDVEDYASYVQQLPDKDARIKANEAHIIGISRKNAFSGGVIGSIYGGGGSEASVVEYATSEANIANISPYYNAYAGGVVGRASYTTINKCQNKGKVKTYCGQTDILGGVVGYATDSTISNCALHSNAYIEGRLQSEGTPTTYISIVGGIVGMMSGGTIAYCATMGATYSNYVGSLTVFLGSIIGYGLDHTIDRDKTCVYSRNNTGFSDAFGVGDKDGMEDVFYDNLDLISNRNDTMVQRNEVFDSDIWDTTEKTLMSEVVYITGCGNHSFKLVDPIDHGSLAKNKGVCIPLSRLETVKLQEDSLGANPHAIAYFLVYNDGLFKLGSNQTGASSVMNLNSLASSMSERAVVIYVTIVEGTI